MYGVINSKRLENIAMAIRDKTGTETTYTPSRMPAGVGEAYATGKIKEWNDFWDKFQYGGKRGSYNYGFAGEGWNDETFKPKYDIVPTTNPGCSFYMCKITDLEAALSNSGIIMDFSKCSNFPQTFYMADFTVIPELDFSGATNTANSFSQTFMRCEDLITIRKIKLPTNGGQTFSSTFSGCNSLQNIIFEGVIGQSINFSVCPLSVESLKSIISCLKAYEIHSCTVTFKASAFAVLEAEGETAEYNGVPCTWAELIDNKKWNLTLA